MHGDVSVNFIIMNQNKLKDIDNIVRYYLMAAKTAGILNDARIMNVVVYTNENHNSEKVRFTIYNCVREM